MDYYLPGDLKQLDYRVDIATDQSKKIQQNNLQKKAVFTEFWTPSFKANLKLWKIKKNLNRIKFQSEYFKRKKPKKKKWNLWWSEHWPAGYYRPGDLAIFSCYFPFFSMKKRFKFLCFFFAPNSNQINREDKTYWASF